MSEDLDLERVVMDPDYRRKAIEDLKRDAERSADADARSQRRDSELDES